MAVNREYSSYSSVHDPDLQFLIREVEGGELTPKLKRLKPGESVEVDGAYGLFTISPELARTGSFYFIGTGTGIAPFHCFVKSFPYLDYHIVHGTRLKSEAYNRDDYAKDRYVNCASQDQAADFHGRVTDYLKEVPPPKSAIFYLCGNRNMINDVYDILRDYGISSSQIVTEVFF